MLGVECDVCDVSPLSFYFFGLTSYRAGRMRRRGMSLSEGSERRKGGRKELEWNPGEHKSQVLSRALR